MELSVLDILTRIPLFDEIKNDEESMKILSRVFTTRTYHQGETIIKEGDVGSEMFIVATGAVEIQKRTRAGDSYTVVKLLASYNVFFGEMALIDDDKRSATVTATEDSEFLVVDKKAFLKLGNDHPQIGLPITRAISKILAGRLRKTTEDMLTIFDALVSEIQS
jgi:CRP-like cAMP-binding protein